MIYSSPIVFSNVVLVKIAQTLLQQFAILQTFTDDSVTHGDLCPSVFLYVLDKIYDASVQTWAVGLTRVSLQPMGDSMWIIFQ